MARHILPVFFLLVSFTVLGNEALVGFWKGKLGENKNVGLEIIKVPGNTWEVYFYDLDYRCMQLASESVTVSNDSLYITLSKAPGTLRGAIPKKDSLVISWDVYNTTLSLGRSNEPLVVKKRKQLSAKGMSPTAPLELEQFMFLLGEFWGFEERTAPDGTEYLQMTVWKAEWILEGNAIQNESSGYIMMDSLTRGQRIQFGQDTRIYDDSENVWRHTYTDASGMVLSINWTMKDGELTSSPTEWGGQLNIIKFKDISPKGFTWTVDTSSDGGKTWVREARVMENRRIKSP